jgi:type IV secretion system protein TrbC
MKIYQQFNKNFWIISLILLFIFMTHPAMAATAGGGLPFEGWLTKLQNSITGPYAFTAAILGLVAAGSALIFGGDMNGVLKTLLVMVLAMSFLVAAQNTLKTITGKGSEITQTSTSLHLEGR